MIDDTLVQLLQERGIPFAVPDSPDFASLQDSVTVTHSNRMPRLIVRARNANDVSAAVDCAAQNNIPVTVRSGGHDLFGRFSAKDALTIDVRDLKYVMVAEDKKTARVGGGATAIQILRALKPHGLQIPIGGCGTVGYTGWTTLGGVGPYTQTYGLGVDQIVGASVVNAEGKLVEANAEMLKMLRGGGGHIGVIVELVVKVFPLTEIQAGAIMHESSDIRQSFTNWLNKFNQLVSQRGKLPNELSVDPTTWCLPRVGVVLMIFYVWNGPESDISRKWQDEIAALAAPMPGMPTPQQSIVKTTILEHIEALHERVIPPKTEGRCETVTIAKWSPSVIEQLANAAAKMPADTQAGIHAHIIRAEGPSFSSQGALDSMCPYREPHTVVEILGYGKGDELVGRATEWAKETRKSLRKLEDVHEKTYYPLTPPDVVDVQTIYGEFLPEMRALKKKYDPKDVFRYALPRLYA